MKRIALLALLCISLVCSAGSDSLLQRGFHYLIQDEDTTAIVFFNQALDQAIEKKDIPTQANALLYTAMASYGSSLHQGIYFVQQALDKFESIGSLIGRGRCLQLMATIKAREGNYADAEQLAREALAIFSGEKDSTGTKALALQLLGSLKEKQQQDSSAYYYHKAFDVRKANNDTLYLSSSLVQEGNMAAREGNKPKAMSFFQEALQLAQQARNKQAEVSSLLAWSDLLWKQNEIQADSLLSRALHLAETLRDKTFLLRCLSLQVARFTAQGDFQQAYHLQEEIIRIKESSANAEAQRLTKSLALQFDVKETERKLLLIQKEHRISRLTNYLLLATVLFVFLAALFGWLYYRKTHKQHKELIATQQSLLELTEEQKRLNEQTLQNEIEFKESQLSAITIQMLQKNKLLEEIQEKLEQREGDLSAGIHKVIHRNQIQEQEWEDFNKSFERVNKNFYSRIKQQYPEISANELKICALIKMNLSIKEMAGILNISPDSVKTARYRLRKKLQLQTEDNLHAFIMEL